MNTTGNKRDISAETVPMYRVIRKDGVAAWRYFKSAAKAAEWAHFIWPDQEQDETRSGKGWDIEAVTLS